MQIRTIRKGFEAFESNRIIPMQKPLERDSKHSKANSNPSKEIPTIRIQIRTIRKEFKAFELKFEPFESDSKHSNECKHSNA